MSDRDLENDSDNDEIDTSDREQASSNDSVSSDSSDDAADDDANDDSDDDSDDDDENDIIAVLRPPAREDLAHERLSYMDTVEFLNSFADKSGPYMREGFKIAVRPDIRNRAKKAPQWTYYLELLSQPATSKKPFTHVCVLCGRLLRLQVTRNAAVHLQGRHRFDKDTPFDRHFFAEENDDLAAARTPAGVVSVLDMIRKQAVADSEKKRKKRDLPVGGNTEQDTRDVFRSRFPRSSNDSTNLIHDAIARLGVEHDMPMSFVEWPAFRDLIDICTLVPRASYTVESEPSYSARLDRTYQHMRSTVGAVLLHQMMSAGQGSMYLTMDGVVTARGELVPILLNWLDEDLNRHSITLATVFEPGKSAADLAAAAFASLAEFRLLELLDTNRNDFVHLHAYEHFIRYCDEYRKEHGDETDESTMVALYALGGATTDGAMLNLFCEMCNNDEAHTTWCISHRLSLAFRFSFGTKDQQSIVPPERTSRTLQIAFNNMAEELVTLYADSRSFWELQLLAKRFNLQPPVKMNSATETRFLSQLNLYTAINDNLKLFRAICDDPATDTPDTIVRLFNPQPQGADPPPGQPDNRVTLSFAKELSSIMPIIYAANDLQLASEGDNVDAQRFQSNLALFINQLDGKHPFKSVGGTHVSLQQLCSHSQLTAALANNLKYSISFYFDKDLEKDWSMLLATILHPRNSGHPATDDPELNLVAKSVRFLRYRFTHLWSKVTGQGQPRMEQDDPKEKIQETHKMMIKILCEETYLQLLIDGKGHLPREKRPRAHDNGNEGRLTTKRARRAQENQSAVDAFMAVSEDEEEEEEEEELDDDEGDAEDEERREDARIRRLAMPTLLPWLRRKPKVGDETFTLVDYWRNEPDSVLRRVVRRIGAFVPTQCGVERVNKVPKQAWKGDRSSMLPKTVIRNTFLHTNITYFPPRDFNWTMFDNPK